MLTNRKNTQIIQTGFTLVEIMVGLAIGMMATIVIMQVFSVFEAQKRTTTGTADAQTNGSIAMYNITREMQLAGFPLMPAGVPSVADSAIECSTVTVDGTADTSPATNFSRLTPATITDGTSDTLVVRYGNSLGGGIPETITAMGAPTANDATVSNNLGCQAGDTTLIVNGGTCALSAASAVSGTTTVTLANTAVAVAGASLSCLGNWSATTFAVNNGNLERNGVPSVVGVVNLQAQYGISTVANSNQITQWVNATGGTWAAPSVANRNRIKALRIAVVARNEKKEAKDPATNTCVTTTACSSTTAAAPTGLCAWEGSALSPAPTIDLTADADWGCYRYRVFETIVPLRNMVWSRGTL